MPGSRASVDSASERSVSFPPPHASGPPRTAGAWEPVAVGPGRSAAVGTPPIPITGDALSRYPIQAAKVQCPALRDETLARDRLLDWLSARIHDRVILVLADAGYGKTTLLADFSRRTRLRTLWYRFEEDDRDWAAVLSHLVAAGREHDPAFAPTTTSLLAELSVGGPTREAVIDVFLRELPTLTQQGAVLILDDFHLADESPDVRLIVRELVARSPERLTIIFSSRRMPSVPLARFRASGEVSEIGTDDLRFDAAETRQLFSETYGRALEPDVLADVVRRTEGWAASLQLVQQALRDRSPSDIRRFVRGMSGADQELYDYLAEEVVGDLPDDLQQFLMRTSILQPVTPELAAVVADLDEAEVARLTAAAERLTLLTRPPRGGQGPHRYHPLVREFLEARLRLSSGPDLVTDLHRRAADAAARIDWRTSAHHYLKAGDIDRVRETIGSAVHEIMGGGQYALAAELVGQIPDGWNVPGLALIKSRIELQRGDFELAANLSRLVLESADPGSVESDHALLNLVATNFNGGDARQTRRYAERLAGTTTSSELKDISEATRLMVDAGTSGDLDAVDRHLTWISKRTDGKRPHFFGVSMLNLSLLSVLRDDPTQAVLQADEAIDALGETSSHLELSAALMAKATALAMLGRTDDARIESDRARVFGHVEAAIETAELLDSFDGSDIARPMLEDVMGRSGLPPNTSRQLVVAYARCLARNREFDEAERFLATLESDNQGTYVGYAVAVSLAMAYLAVASGHVDARQRVDRALRVARAQGAHGPARAATILSAVLSGADALSRAVRAIGVASPWHLTFLADVIGPELGKLDSDSLAIVGNASQMHPGRWRSVIRGLIARAPVGEGIAAARILESIGDRSDVRRLREYSKRQRRNPGTGALGRDLARRSADQVFVEDQNRVTIFVGARQIPGSSIRRKVLALLCLLLTKPDLSSTRDQVLDALWPELNPTDAVNSLNQTVYFLRRVFEEDYVEDLSPGYVHHDSDVIWLDRGLVMSRSNTCRSILRRLPVEPSPDEVMELADAYEGRFALDFEYEEWAGPYRDWLHASYLEVIERAVGRDLETGHHERGIRLARRVLDIDPAAEQAEVSLLRLYRASGAHAAAAEQYGHYAAAMREQLGVEPPPLESL